MPLNSYAPTFKTWGTQVNITSNEEVPLDQVADTIGLYGYQQTGLTLSVIDLTNLNRFTLQQIVDAAPSLGIKYIQFSYNLNGTTLTDLAIGIVATKSAGNQLYQILLHTLIGGIITNGQTLFKAYSLNEAPTNNWVMIVGITGGIIAVAAIAYLIGKRRK